MLGGLNNLYRMSLLLTADVRGFSSGLSRAETRLSKFSTRATAFGRSTARGLGLAFAFVGASAVRAAADFDRANAVLEKIVGLAGIESLTKQAKELGRSSVFMATDIAKAQLEIAKLGLTGQGLESVLEKAKDVATIFGTEIDATGKTILSTLRQFGLAADNTEEGAENVAFAADVMASAFKNSALDLSKFNESMKNVGPTARATGLDMVQTTALLAVLANNAVQGSLGGTKLRSTLSDLAKQFPDVAVALERLENGTLSYSELVELLNKRAALVGAIFQDQGDEIRDFEAILRNATGTVDVLSEGLEERLFFQVERLKNAFQSLGITIGDGVAPIVAELADFTEKLAIAFDDMDPKEIEEIGRSIVFFLEAAGGAYLIGKALRGISLLRDGWSSLNKAVNVGGGNMVNFGQAIKNIGGPILAITGLIYGAQKAVEVAFSEETILSHNAQLKKTKEEYDAITESVERLRRAEDLRLRDERRLPAQGAKQLEEFLKIDPVTDSAGLIKVLDDLTFFEQQYAEAAKEIDRINQLITFAISNNLPFEDLRIDQQDLRKFQVDTQTYIDAYKRYLDFISGKKSVDGLTSADIGDGGVEDDGKVAGIKIDVPLRFGEQVVIDKTLDNLNEILKVQQGIQELPKVGTEGIFGFDEDQTEAQAIGIFRAAQSINALSQANIDAANSGKVLALSLQNVIEISDSVDDLLTNLEKLQFVGDAVANAVSAAVEDSRIKELQSDSEQLYSFLQTQLDFIGQAFLQATESGEKFFDVLKKTFLSTYQAIIAKLITLVSVYAVLALLSGGSGQIAQLASTAMGENFSAFLGKGFGLPTGVRSASANIGDGGTAPIVKVEGFLSGNNIVLANQRGSRALDRTFG